MAIAQKHCLLSLSCLLFVSMLSLTTGAEEQAKDASHSILFGSGHGIDHVGIAVRDLETAKKTYRDVLGFAVFAFGKESSGNRSGGSYLESGLLELTTSGDPTKPIGRVIGKSSKNTKVRSLLAWKRLQWTTQRSCCELVASISKDRKPGR